jgi:hypothetical protein
MFERPNDEWIEDAVRLAAIMAAIRFPKGTKLRGLVATLPTGERFRIVPLKDGEQ